MGEIKPKYSVEHPVAHSFYGLHSCTDGKGIGKKSTYVCLNIECGYSSRVPRWATASKISYNSSVVCPIHKEKLLNIGDVLRLPKVGSKKRMLVLKRLIRQ